MFDDESWKFSLWCKFISNQSDWYKWSSEHIIVFVLPKKKKAKSYITKCLLINWNYFQRKMTTFLKVPITQMVYSSNFLIIKSYIMLFLLLYLYFLFESFRFFELLKKFWNWVLKITLKYHRRYSQLLNLK